MKNDFFWNVNWTLFVHNAAGVQAVHWSSCKPPLETFQLNCKPFDTAKTTSQKRCTIWRYVCLIFPNLLVVIFPLIKYASDIGQSHNLRVNYWNYWVQQIWSFGWLLRLSPSVAVYVRHVLKEKYSWNPVFLLVCMFFRKKLCLT